VPDDERDQVFDRFFRGGRPEVAETSGTGIGLAVVKELAQRMGGSVSVENREPRGAIFTVTLPNC
jgi:signal transduction histidine kinase